MQHQRGFTLVELVVTMILISIMAITVVPKFFGPSEFAVFAVRDQLLGQLRLAQLQAMNRRGTTHNLLITSSQFGLARSTLVGETVLASGAQTAVELDDVSISIAGDSSLSLRFDASGKISAGDCAGGCTLKIIGSETLSIIIESEGYVHASS